MVSYSDGRGADGGGEGSGAENRNGISSDGDCIGFVLSLLLVFVGQGLCWW